MINNLDVHAYILILENYMNYMFSNGWARDVIRLIVKMINDQYVDVGCGNNYTIILKNGNLYICDSHIDDRKISDIVVSKHVKHHVENVLKIGCLTHFQHDVENVLKIGCNMFNAKCIMNDRLYEINKWHCDEENGVIVNKLCINDIEHQHNKIMVTDISEIVCGSYHTFYVMKDGLLYGYGFNTSGELGLGDYEFREFIKLNLVVNRVFTKYSHSFAFTKDGRVLGWGCNDNGQLGHDGVNNVPRELMLSNVIYICCSYNHSLIIVKLNDSMNKIYICGNIRGYDRLINGGTLIRELILIGGDWTNHIASTVSGIYETMALTNNGNVYCWSNDYYLDHDNYANIKCSTVKLNICNVRLIKSGNYHNVFVTCSEEIYYRDSTNVDQNVERCDSQRLLRIDV